MYDHKRLRPVRDRREPFRPNDPAASDGERETRPAPEPAERGARAAVDQPNRAIRPAHGADRPAQARNGSRPPAPVRQRSPLPRLEESLPERPDAVAGLTEIEEAPSTSAFAAFNLHRLTVRALDGIGITDPTPIQAEAIPALLAGRDVIGQARTGSGKTLAFAIPLVEIVDATQPAVQALVLVPTRELAIQVAGVIGSLIGSRRHTLTLLYGGRSLLTEHKALKAGPHIVVGTPGRTLDHLRQGYLSLGRVRMFVLDEADEMLDRGFAPDVERIMAMTPASRQTALFSATVPDWVLKTAERHLRNPVQLHVDRNVAAPPEIEHLVYDVDSAGKLAALRTLLDARGDAPMIVFGRTKHGVKKLAKQLEGLGYPVGALQGNLSQNARERVMAGFRSGAVPILLATNVAARGIDVEGVGQVINYELPESAEWFTHRAGRTGRMGRQGEAITFLTPDDADKWKQIEKALGKRLPRKPWPGSSAEYRVGSAEYGVLSAEKSRAPGRGDRLVAPERRGAPDRRVVSGTEGGRARAGEGASSNGSARNGAQRSDGPGREGASQRVNGPRGGRGQTGHDRDRAGSSRPSGTYRGYTIPNGENDGSARASSNGPGEGRTAGGARSDRQGPAQSGQARPPARRRFPTGRSPSNPQGRPTGR